VVIYLKASDDEVVERLPDRMICGQCQMPFHKKHAPFKSCPYGKCQGQYLYQRDDDQPKIIRARLRAFHRATASLAHYYQEQSKLIILNGQHSIEQVHQAILDELHAVDRAETRTASPEEAAKIHALKDVRPALAEDQAKHPSLDIILLGAPGSGKGTQAVQLGKLLNLKRIATGDLFRKNIEERTRLGMIAKKYMDRGELVPDNVTESMVRDRLSRDDTQRGFILDGFPRTLPQAEALTEIMTDMNRRISVVVYMNVSDEEIVDRLSGRIICRKCQSPFHEKFNPFETCPYNQCQGEHLYQREDDKPKTVRTRLRTYHRQTAPLIEYYSNDGLLVEVNGVGDVSDIFNHVVAAIQEVTKVELA
jgi:adenylate kinase